MAKKVTKSQIIEGFKAMASKFTLSAQAQSELDYTVDSFEENPRNVTMDDLKVLRQVLETETGHKIVDYIEGVAPTQSNVENKVKALPSKKEQANNVKEENSVKPVEPKEEEKEEENPPVEEPKQEATESISKIAKPHNDYLAKFPETLVSESLKGTLKVRRDLKTIQDVANAWAKGEDITIATYWSKKLLKQYSQGYDPMNINPNRPKSFEHDLDLIEVTFANELVVTGCSLYSYVPQIFVPYDFEADEDEMRYANGCEFEIYEIIEDK